MMQCISNYIPVNPIGKWLFGASMFPVELALRELFLTVAKSSRLCNETQIEYYKKNFQKIEYKQSLVVLNQSSTINRFVVEKLVSLFQASNIALIEGAIIRFGLQYCVFTLIPSCCYANQADVSEEGQLLSQILRITATAAVYGLLNYTGADWRNERKANKLSMEKAKNERNFQMIGAFASGLVYSTIYEVTKQSFWAAQGCHTMWNFVHDLVTVKGQESAQLEVSSRNRGDRELAVDIRHSRN